eukprot:m.19293 g.19293  ORF g.19293 m.19293 type:complete len:56 (+) comp11757_c0_seq1:374-541(+)
MTTISQCIHTITCLGMFPSLPSTLEDLICRAASVVERGHASSIVGGFTSAKDFYP